MAIAFPKDFDSLLSWARAHNGHGADPNPDYAFIGTGVQNVNLFQSKILILGMEPGIDPNDPDDPTYYHRIAIDNLHQWNVDVRNSTDAILRKPIPLNPPKKYTSHDYVSPYFPYPGEAVHGIKPAATWYYYQKLINAIIVEWMAQGQSTVTNPVNKGTDYNFHDFSFVTDMSAVPSKSMKGWKSAKPSILARVALFKQPFFQNFPIVIAATGRTYPDRYPGGAIRQTGQTYGGYFTDTFGVVTPSVIKPIRGQLYGIYLASNKSKILIHCRQLSNGVSQSTLQTIAKEVVDFAIKNNIRILP